MTKIVHARVKIRWLALVLATFTVAACGGGGGSPATPSSPAVTSTAPPPISTATISWAAPNENTDGSALTNLAGYRIYYGTTATDLTQVIDIPTVGMTEYVIDNLTAGTYYFSIRAYTSAGIESALSNVVTTTIA
jgi:hypothetical protein